MIEGLLRRFRGENGAGRKRYSVKINCTNSTCNGDRTLTFIFSPDFSRDKLGRVTVSVSDAAHKRNGSTHFYLVDISYTAIVNGNTEIIDNTLCRAHASNVHYTNEFDSG